MNIYLIAGLILSALIGLSLGLIGGGGSIITVPVLVYVIGVEVHEAVGMSLAVVGGTSLIGSLLHARRGTLELTTGIIFGISGTIGALVGSPLTHLLSPPALMMTFAVLMIVIAILMIVRQKKNEELAAGGENIHEKMSLWKALAAGFGVGVMTGFLGVGGGFLIVPALVMFGGLPIKKAIGTSLLVIFLNCVAGLVGHASQNHFNWRLTAMVTGLAALGTIAGTLLSHRLPGNRLQKGFAYFVLAVALILITKNFAAFTN